MFEDIQTTFACWKLVKNNIKKRRRSPNVGQAFRDMDTIHQMLVEIQNQVRSGVITNTEFNMALDHCAEVIDRVNSDITGIKLKPKTS